MIVASVTTFMIDSLWKDSSGKWCQILHIASSTIVCTNSARLSAAVTTVDLCLSWNPAIATLKSHCHQLFPELVLPIIDHPTLRHLYRAVRYSGYTLAKRVLRRVRQVFNFFVQSDSK